MRQSSTSSATPAGPDASSGDTLRRGFVSGLVPLGPLALTVPLTLGLAVLARQLTAAQTFVAQQWAAGIVVVLGLLGGAVAYVIFSVRALRQVKRRQQAGQTALANGALWGLVVVALVVILPLLLAILIPQHPAPILAP